MSQVFQSMQPNLFIMILRKRNDTSWSSIPMVVSMSLMQTWSFSETGRPGIQLCERNHRTKRLFIHHVGVRLPNQCVSNVHRVQQLSLELCRWIFLSDNWPQIESQYQSWYIWGPPETHQLMGYDRTLWECSCYANCCPNPFRQVG